MEFAGHKNIKRFQIEGIVADDSYLPMTVETQVNLLVQMMEDSGYTPVVDVGPFWSTKYVEEEDIYEFLLTGFGVYVGKKKACLTYGIVNGQILMKDSPLLKPQESYEESEYE